jgi:hypothetical protein
VALSSISVAAMVLACSDPAGPTRQPVKASEGTSPAQTFDVNAERAHAVALPAVSEEGKTLGGAAAIAYLRKRFAEAAANGDRLPDVAFRFANGQTERLAASQWLSRLEAASTGTGITATPNPRYDDTLTVKPTIVGNSLVVIGGSGTRFDFVTTSMAWTADRTKAELEKIIQTGRRVVTLTGGPPLYDVTTSDSSGSLKLLTSVTYPTTWPSMTIGKGCGYVGALTSAHTLRWNDRKYWPLLAPGKSYDNSLDSKSINRPCIPPPDPTDPSSLCDNPSACSPAPGPGGYYGGGSVVGVDGLVGIPTAPGGGGGGSSLVCTVTDWYDVWMDGSWHYRGTEFNGCVLS